MEMRLPSGIVIRVLGESGCGRSSVAYPRTWPCKTSGYPRGCASSTCVRKSMFTQFGYNDTALLTTSPGISGLLFECTSGHIREQFSNAISSCSVSPLLLYLVKYVVFFPGSFSSYFGEKIRTRNCNSPTILQSFLCTDLTQGLIWLARPHERYTPGQWRRLYSTCISLFFCPCLSFSWLLGSLVSFSCSVFTLIFSPGEVVKKEMTVGKLCRLGRRLAKIFGTKPVGGDFYSFKMTFFFSPPDNWRFYAPTIWSISYDCLPLPE